MIARRFDMPDDAQAWMWHGEHGVSSMTIVARVLGLPLKRRDHPHDMWDLRRCVLMLESCPSVSERFYRMRSESGTWAKLVDAWPSLVASMDAEVHDWRERCEWAPKTNRALREIIESEAA